jgi:hypothetical protein
MEDKKELTGIQGLVGGIVFTIVLLLTLGLIKLPQNDVSLGIRYAEENDAKEIEICEYKFDDNDIAKESCQEYVQSKYPSEEEPILLLKE